MDVYSATSEQVAKTITLRYSTSFSSASRLFGSSVRSHIYNIYAVVRVADEIVDTYRGRDAVELLGSYEQDIYAALSRGYSTDMVIHAFAQTARQFEIDESLIKPFFASMRTDISAPKKFSTKAYRTYIHGSAEVIGLMCLRVFCMADLALNNKLSDGASALGSAFQKINFLRDLADDTSRLGRNYFPNTSRVLTEKNKTDIIEDISKDLVTAYAAIVQLPDSSRTAVLVAYAYYNALLGKLSTATIETIYDKRIRVPNLQKIYILCRTLLTAWLIRRPADA